MEKIADIYLIAGQSNAVGSTLITGGAGACYQTQKDKSFLDETLCYPHVLYNHVAHTLTKGGGYRITDFVPVTQGLGFTPERKHIGPELGMAQILDPIYAKKENTDAIIIKVASGGTKLTHHFDDANQPLEEIIAKDGYSGNFGTWYPESMWDVRDGENKVDLWSERYYRLPTGFLFREFVSFIKDNFKWLKDRGYTQINFKALCWMQGESDRGVPDLYQTCFSAFASDLRRCVSEISGQDYSLLPIICGEISRTFMSALPDSTKMNEEFIAMQNGLEKIIPGVYIVPSASFDINLLNDKGESVAEGSDCAHFNYEDMLSLGKAFAQKCIEIG